MRWELILDWCLDTRKIQNIFIQNVRSDWGGGMRNRVLNWVGQPVSRERVSDGAARSHTS